MDKIFLENLGHLSKKSNLRIDELDGDTLDIYSNMSTEMALRSPEEMEKIRNEISKLPHPVKIFPETLGSYLFSPEIKYFGDLKEKSCSPFILGKCSRQVWMEDKGDINKKNKVSSNSAYIFLTEERKLKISEIENLKNSEVQKFDAFLIENYNHKWIYEGNIVIKVREN